MSPRARRGLLESGKKLSGKKTKKMAAKKRAAQLRAERNPSVLPEETDNDVIVQVGALIGVMKEDVVKSFERATQIEFYKMLVAKAGELLRGGKYDESLEILESLRKEYGSQELIMFFIARVLFKKGDRAEAFEISKAIWSKVELDERHVAADDLYFFALSQGDLDLAVETSSFILEASKNGMFRNPLKKKDLLSVGLVNLVARVKSGAVESDIDEFDSLTELDLLPDDVLEILLVNMLVPEFKSKINPFLNEFILRESKESELDAFAWFSLFMLKLNELGFYKEALLFLDEAYKLDIIKDDLFFQRRLELLGLLSEMTELAQMVKEVAEYGGAFAESFKFKELQEYLSGNNKNLAEGYRSINIYANYETNPAARMVQVVILGILDLKEEALALLSSLELEGVDSGILKLALEFRGDNKEVFFNNIEQSLLSFEDNPKDRVRVLDFLNRLLVQNESSKETGFSFLQSLER